MHKILKITMLVLLLALSCFMVIKVVRSYKSKKGMEARMQTLPKASFLALNNEIVNLHSFDETKPLVIIYFHPECEHCQYEAKEIGQNAPAFRSCQLLMVTADDSIKRVEQFCTLYNLWEVDNIEILLDKKDLFKKTFGKAVVPSVYIYGKDRKLKKRFLGETKPEAIIDNIQED